MIISVAINFHLFPDAMSYLLIPPQMRSHQNQVPHPYLAPGRFLACALPHSGRRGQVGLWPRGCKPNAKVSTSSDVMSLFPISVLFCDSSYRIPTWRQGRFLACALPHSGRGGQVGLWPRGCKLSTKVGTSCSSLAVGSFYQSLPLQGRTPIF